MLEASPTFRDELFPQSTKPEDRFVVAQMRGKKLPAIGRIEISIVEESNPRLLSFEKGELDYVTVPTDLVSNVLTPQNTLKPELASQGMLLARGIQPAVTYTYFNMEDPVVGGYTKDKIALRRAISMAYNVDEEIRIIRQGQGERRHAADPSQHVGLRPESQEQHQLRPRGRQGASRQVWLHRSRSRRLARPSRRQAAQDIDGRRPIGAHAPVFGALADAT